MKPKVFACAVALVAGILVLGQAGAALAEEIAPTRDYYYWYTGAQSKIYTSSTQPSGCAKASQPSTKALSLTAAQSEYEGRQIMLRPNLGTITDVWLEPSDLTYTDASGFVSTIPASNVSVFKVGYVKISKPSYGYHRVGYEPDPLIPMKLANGEKLGWQSSGGMNLSFRSIGKAGTRPFYVLFFVPEGSVPGTYTGTITISARGDDSSLIPDVKVPVSLNVYGFSIKQRTLPTSVWVSLEHQQYWGTPWHGWLGVGSGPDRVSESTYYHADQINEWYRFLNEHRLSPSNMLPAWNGGSDWAPPTDDGSMVPRYDHLLDYVTTGTATTYVGERFAFNAIRLPESGRPSYVKNPFTSSSAKAKAAKYYSTARAALLPWLSKTYVFEIDEPHEHDRAQVERYASFIHQVAPGVKFMCTVPSLEFHNKPPRYVDIFVQRLHFYYRDYGPWVSKIRASHKQVWIYLHATPYQNQTPMFIIDKPLAEVRSIGWFAWDTRAAGLMYYNVDRWVAPYAGASTRRDPYKDPLSWQTKYNGSYMRANGDGSLSYPGYYPAQGLTVMGAPPVGSLRMEALRDGLEDYEYLKLLQVKGNLGLADYYNHKVIGKPKTVVSGGRATFPYYPKSGSAYDSIRRSVASRLAVF
jgi:hypothetical protein